MERTEGSPNWELQMKMVAKDDILGWMEEQHVPVQVTEHIDVRSDQNTSIPQTSYLQIPSNYIGKQTILFLNVQKMQEYRQSTHRRKSPNLLFYIWCSDILLWPWLWRLFYGCVQWSITLAQITYLLTPPPLPPGLTHMNLTFSNLPKFRFAAGL